jgi:hypothetical protein
MTRIVHATVVSVIFGCFALLPPARAVLPAPDGGYGPPDYGTGNTAEGEDALLNLSSGAFNTATGFRALNSITTGNFNTAIGAGALFFNTGDDNTAVGSGALLSNTTGTRNTATGESALFHNISGRRNTAAGESALSNNISSNNNTATGSGALLNNSIGDDNTAVGDGALFRNITGSGNTATGISTLLQNTSGVENTANGFYAMFSNTTGRLNTAIGDRALFSNTTGLVNVALGYRAGASLTTGNNNIAIGNAGVAGDASTIRIGGNVGFGPQTATFIAGIRGVTTGNNNAIPVMIDSAGQLGTVSSSLRYKTEVKPIDKASESILALKPVSFRYKVHKDTTPQFGLIAEEVAKVNPDLVIYDSDGEPYTVRYDAVNAMLLNEFLKEHRHVQEQDAIIARQQKQIDALAAGLQKVSAQLATASPSLAASK